MLDYVLSENFSMVKQKVTSAVKDFLSKESSLLERDLYEVAVSSKLMSYVARAFPDHAVDSEYDKHGQSDKMLKDRKVRPDIVVHRRGDDAMNLLVIEMKKRNKPIKKDIDKLVDFTEPNGTDGYCYDFGLFLAFSRDSDGKYHSHPRWFIAGKECPRRS